MNVQWCGRRQGLYGNPWAITCYSILYSRNSRRSITELAIRANHVTHNGSRFRAAGELYPSGFAPNASKCSLAA